MTRGLDEPSSATARRRRRPSRERVGSRIWALSLSIQGVGLDQFANTTLSIGPVLGYRGYDVGAAIASDLYGPPAAPRRFPSLPADEQDGSRPLVTPSRALGVLGVGMAAGMAGSLLLSALRRRSPPQARAARWTLLDASRRKSRT